MSRSPGYYWVINLDWRGSGPAVALWVEYVNHDPWWAFAGNEETYPDGPNIIVLSGQLPEPTVQASKSS